jgi:monofunctional biosynthetic peptidoglycan transglycosylase
MFQAPRKDEWMEVKFPSRNFAATWRGRDFPNQKLDPGDVTGLGFLMGDKKPGPFKLEVDSMKAGTATPQPSKPTSN